MIRPPIAEMRAMIAARARRHPSPAGTPYPASSRYVSRSATAMTPIGIGIMRLRQLCGATISRTATTQSTTGNARSTAAASQSGRTTETRQAIRPTSQSTASPTSGAPWIGGRPVQLGIAVSMKPAMVAGTKPNSMAWMCQESGSKRLSSAPPVVKRTIHKVSASAAQITAARKKGRNARAHRPAPGLATIVGAAIATARLLGARPFLRSGPIVVLPGSSDDSVRSCINDTSGADADVCRANGSQMRSLSRTHPPRSAISRRAGGSSDAGCV
jgi:hypothetical protein